ncbi:DUF2071 domain-containing protein [Arthrobacter sp. MPF02]|uniref:DUF2071 domain-containing protein n=1 Tax=Arthrobacter sp. MPF02 TaxID=3388492 RepID=UPI00398473E1
MAWHLKLRAGPERGRTIYIPNSHEPWPLYTAELHGFEDGLVAAAGIGVNGPPESILFSPGVRARFGLPRVVPGEA